MGRVDALIKKIESNGHDVWIAGGATPRSIAKLESLVGNELPATYKLFLAKYGALAIYDEFVSGIIDDDPGSSDGGGMHADTIAMRQNSVTVPMNLWVLKRHEDGAYCFDLSRLVSGDKCTIVNFEVGSVQHEEPIAGEFTSFLIDWVLSGYAG